MGKYLLPFLIVLAGCQQRPVDPTIVRSTAELDPALYSNDPVWTSYRFKGPMPRAFVYTNQGWRSTGREVTADDLAKAPCPVILGKYSSSAYDATRNVIYLDKRDKVSVLWHESRHCLDWHAGIRDAREMERRAMIAEVAHAAP